MWFGKKRHNPCFFTKRFIIFECPVVFVCSTPKLGERCIWYANNPCKGSNVVPYWFPLYLSQQYRCAEETEISEETVQKGLVFEFPWLANVARWHVHTKRYVFEIVLENRCRSTCNSTNIGRTLTHNNIIFNKTPKNLSQGTRGTRFR